MNFYLDSKIYIKKMTEFYYFCTLNINLMVRSLLLVWILAVIAFFVLWALIALMVRRISEKRRTKNEEHDSDLLNSEF